jgi:hypothetical protein
MKDEIYESLKDFEISPQLLKDIEEDVTRLYDPKYRAVGADPNLEPDTDPDDDDDTAGAARGPVKQTKPVPQIGLSASDMVQNFSLDLQNYLDSFSERIRNTHVEQHEFLMIDALSQVCDKYKEEKKKSDDLERKIADLTKKMEKMGEIKKTEDQGAKKQTDPSPPSSPASAKKKKSNKLSNIRKSLKEGKINKASYDFIQTECNTPIVQKNMIAAIKVFCGAKNLDIADEATFGEAMCVLESYLESV